jgi:ribonucleotide monophosphatase NagD (HAD superfamily)
MSLPETTVRALAEAHAAVLLDAYGVLVSGEGVMPGAPELIRDLTAAGRPYLVLTNDASKRPATAVKRYAAWGLHLDPERIVTSGALLAPYFAQAGLHGARTLVMGPPDSVAYAEDAGAEVVPLTSSDAEVLVIADEAGYPFLETLDHVLSVVLRRVGRGDPIHLVLPNPDLIYPKRSGPGPASRARSGPQGREDGWDGSAGPGPASRARSGPQVREDGWDGSAGPGPASRARSGPQGREDGWDGSAGPGPASGARSGPQVREDGWDGSAGPGPEYGLAAGSIARVIEDALALRYPRQVGLQFARLGKPYPTIFQAALERTGTMDMVMVGDTLATDIRGARAFGLAAGLVTWGLTGPLPPDLPESERPTHLVRAF